MDPMTLAQRAHPLAQRIDEFLREPALTVACVFLIVVSIAWIVIVRAIAHNLRRAALRRGRPSRPYSPPRDIWAEPPP
jgi:hypothetical protein